MHLKRWITSLVALPLVIYLIVLGGIPFILLICTVCLTSLWEFYSIVFPEKMKISSFSLLGMISGCLVIVDAARPSYNYVLLLLAFNFVACGIVCVLKKQVDEVILQVMAKQVLSIIYVPLMLAFLVLIRMGENGTTWIFYLLIIVFVGDTGAYYVGTYMGKHRLLPSVSPKKTIEGALGGIGANLMFGSLINAFLPKLPWGLDMPLIPWIPAIAFFIITGAVGQLGDLFESLYKRAANIKDSGKILPGHGGILDRIDALLFAAPVAFIFIRCME